MYRILHAEHHRTGDKWCIYPMYDWAHGQSDSIEGITHSICTLEFENHRPLYDWFIEQLGIYHPQQIEFARLNLTYTVLSKRRLIQLVTGEARPRLGRPAHADDLRRPPPRLHARGDPQVLRAHRRLEVRRRHRHVLAGGRPARGPQQAGAARAWRVLRPLQGRDRELPGGPDRGAGRGQQPGGPVGRHAQGAVLDACSTSSRTTSARTRRRTSSASRPGREVRLRYAYFVKCTGVDEGRATGEVDRAALHLRPGDARRRRPGRPQGQGDDPLGLAPSTPIDAEVRLYDHLFTKPDPDDVPEGQDYLANLNPKSLEVLNGCQAGAEPGGRGGRRASSSSSGSAILRGQGFDAGQAGVQPRGDAARHVGEDREEEMKVNHEVHETHG